MGYAKNSVERDMTTMTKGDELQRARHQKACFAGCANCNQPSFQQDISSAIDGGDHEID